MSDGMSREAKVLTNESDIMSEVCLNHLLTHNVEQPWRSWLTRHMMAAEMIAYRRGAEKARADALEDARVECERLAETFRMESLKVRGVTSDSFNTLREGAARCAYNIALINGYKPKVKQNVR